MAVLDQLPVSGSLTFDDMADTYGVARTAYFDTMYKSGKINLFSLKKPTDMPGLFVSDPDGIDGDRSLICPLWDGSSSPQSWIYRRPSGGESSPYRGEDSRGYYRMARPFATSGRTAAISFQWSVRSPRLVFTFERPTHAGNLQAGHVRQHGSLLSEWYWCVLLRNAGSVKAPGTLIGIAGSYNEFNGLTAYAKLGESDGNRIELPLSADQVDGFNGGEALFFLARIDTAAIQGRIMTDTAVQNAAANATKISVWFGTDPATGENWLNLVPLKLTRSSGNILMDQTGYSAPYYETYVSAGGYAAEEVAAAAYSDVYGMIYSVNATYTEGRFGLSVRVPANPLPSARSATVIVYPKRYASAAAGGNWTAIPEVDKAFFTITQAADTSASIRFADTSGTTIAGTLRLSARETQQIKVVPSNSNMAWKATLRGDAAITATVDGTSLSGTESIAFYGTKTLNISAGKALAGSDMSAVLTVAADNASASLTITVESDLM